MIGDLFHALLYQPIYNGLVFLISVVPYGDIGFSIILLTIIVKLLLFPLTHRSVKTQARLRSIEGEVKSVKKQYEKNKQEQAIKVMELYKTHGINPFSGCLPLLVQIPIIIALYWVFWKGLTNGIEESILYSFVGVPQTQNMIFLGLIDLSQKSIFLALCAGITQYFQIKLATPFFGEVNKEKKEGEKSSFKEEFARSFRLQMKYGLPVIVFFVSYQISAAIALYWTTSNVFSIAHEYIVKKKAKTIVKSEENAKMAQ